MIDLVAFADRLPGPGETLVGSRFLQGFGGKGANQAVAAARFGASVTMVGAVGDDANGRSIVENLRAQAVATDDVEVAAATSGVAAIWVDGQGMNRIIIVPGANALVDGDVAAAAVRRIRPAVVAAQLEIPQAAITAAFAAAREIGAITILNPAPGAPLDPRLLATTDWLIPNETEFVVIGGRPLTAAGTGPELAADEVAAIDELGRRLDVAIVVTLGERGVALRRRAGAARWIGTPAVRAVDSTGAGDAFVGAFAVGLAIGWPPESAAALGCAMASDSVTRAGAQGSFASPADALAILDRLAPFPGQDDPRPEPTDRKDRRP
jgi:ribokinase